MILPLALAVPPVAKLPLVSVPVALINPPVKIFAPVILPPVIVPVVLIVFDPNAASNDVTFELLYVAARPINWLPLPKI